jgi:hypothetical protein
MATIPAFEKDVQTVSVNAGEDLSAYQNCAVKYSSGLAVKCSVKGERCIGILTDDPAASGRAGTIAVDGIVRAKMAGSGSQGARVCVGTTAALVTATDGVDFEVGTALSDWTAGATIPVKLSMGGAINRDRIMAKVVHFTAAQLIASNGTPLVLCDYSADLAAGLVSAGDVYVYHDAIVQMDGGTANYDQAQNFIVKYQEAGGGATVSTTLANFCSGGADGKLGTIKQLVTDIVPEAAQDLVLTSSASPKNAAGDRELNVKIYYSVYSPV